MKRKFEPFLLLALIAGVSIGWRGFSSDSPPPPVSPAMPLTGPPTAPPLETVDLRLAGLTIGLTPAEVQEILGRPKEYSTQASRQTWKYGGSDGYLSVNFREGKTTRVGGSGRWQLQRAGRSLPAFGNDIEHLEKFMGTPIRSKTSQYYESRFRFANCDLNVMYDVKGVIAEVWLEKPHRSPFNQP